MVILGKIVNCVDDQVHHCINHIALYVITVNFTCIVKIYVQINYIKEELDGWQLQYSMRVHTKRLIVSTTI